MSNTITNVIESLNAGTITIKSAVAALSQFAKVHGLPFSESVARRTKGQCIASAEKLELAYQGSGTTTKLLQAHEEPAMEPDLGPDSSEAMTAEEIEAAQREAHLAHQEHAVVTGAQVDPGPFAGTPEEMGQAVVEAHQELAAGVAERAQALISGESKPREEKAVEPKKARGESKFAFIVGLFDGRTVAEMVDAVCERFPGSTQGWAVGYIRQVAYDVNTGYAKGYSHLEGKIVRQGRGTGATIAIQG